MPSIPSLRGSKAPWPGGDDQRAGEVRPALVGADREQLLAVLAQALERLNLLAEMHLGPVLEALLGAELDERRPLDLRMAGDVVDVLLRVDRRDLTAELLEALDHPHRGVAVACVVRGGEAGGPAPRMVMSTTPLSVTADNANGALLRCRAPLEPARALVLRSLRPIVDTAEGQPWTPTTSFSTSTCSRCSWASAQLGARRVPVPAARGASR
jgi:hypothetical protein